MRFSRHPLTAVAAAFYLLAIASTAAFYLTPPARLVVGGQGVPGDANDSFSTTKCDGELVQQLLDVLALAKARHQSLRESFERLSFRSSQALLGSATNPVNMVLLALTAGLACVLGVVATRGAAERARHSRREQQLLELYLDRDRRWAACTAEACWFAEQWQAEQRRSEQLKQQLRQMAEAPAGGTDAEPEDASRSPTKDQVSEQAQLQLTEERDKVGASYVLCTSQEALAWPARAELPAVCKHAYDLLRTLCCAAVCIHTACRCAATALQLLAEVAELKRKLRGSPSKRNLGADLNDAATGSPAKSHSPGSAAATAAAVRAAEQQHLATIGQLQQQVDQLQQQVQEADALAAAFAASPSPAAAAGGQPLPVQRTPGLAAAVPASPLLASPLSPQLHQLLAPAVVSTPPSAGTPTQQLLSPLPSPMAASSASGGAGAALVPYGELSPHSPAAQLSIVQEVAHLMHETAHLRAENNAIRQMLVIGSPGPGPTLVTPPPGVPDGMVVDRPRRRGGMASGSAAGLNAGADAPTFLDRISGGNGSPTAHALGLSSPLTCGTPGSDASVKTTSGPSPLSGRAAAERQASSLLTPARQYSSGGVRASGDGGSAGRRAASGMAAQGVDSPSRTGSGSNAPHKLLAVQQALKELQANVSSMAQVGGMCGGFTEAWIRLWRKQLAAPVRHSCKQLHCMACACWFGGRLHLTIQPAVLCARSGARGWAAAPTPQPPRLRLQGTSNEGASGTAGCGLHGRALAPFEARVLSQSPLRTGCRN